jgi:predicted DNA-binding protein (UPF0251 family)
MARPTKWRKIENMPAIPYFIPSDKAAAKIPENVLKLEELEAIRLKDLEGLEQSECAQKMEVSRPTFQRILISAREKISDSLVNAKAIRIEGGNFTCNICPVRCQDCAREWTESYEKMDSARDGDCVCPACGSTRVVCGQSCKGKFCRGSCCRRGKARNKYGRRSAGRRSKGHAGLFDLIFSDFFHMALTYAGVGTKNTYYEHKIKNAG